MPILNSGHSNYSDWANLEHYCKADVRSNCIRPKNYWSFTILFSREGGSTLSRQHKFKRGNSKLSGLSQNHTDHKSREGVSSSSTTNIFISTTDKPRHACKITSQLGTLNPPNIVPYATQPISNNKAFGIKMLQHSLQSENQTSHHRRVDT